MKAYEAMTRPEGRQAFDLGREPAKVREQYGLRGWELPRCFTALPGNGAERLE